MGTSKEKRARKVQVWIFHSEEGRAPLRFLILRTRRDRGGFWQPVTGSVEPGETLAAAALREAREETALPFRGRARSLRASFDFVSRRGNPVRESGYGLEARKISPVVLDPKEHVDFEWVSAAEARRRIRYPSNRKFLDLWVARLKQNEKRKETSSHGKSRRTRRKRKPRSRKRPLRRL